MIQTTTRNTSAENTNQVKRNHDKFLGYSTREGRYHRKTAQRTHGIKEDDGVKLPTRIREMLLEPKVSVYPEFAAFTFHLEGCPRNLLTYIIFYELDVQDGQFRFNDQVIDRFHEYCEMFGKSYKESAVKQGLRTLVDRNIILNKKRGLYLVNPLLVGGTSEARRQELINDYSKQLLSNGKDLALDFYPVYQKSR